MKCDFQMSNESCCVVIEIPPPKVKRVTLVRYKGIDRGFKIGRGYSLGELKEVGLNRKMAKYLNIPIDPRRKSVYNENIENLKKFLESVKELINAEKAKPARLISSTAVQ